MGFHLREPTFDYQKQVFLGFDHLQMLVANVLEAPMDSCIIEGFLDHIILEHAYCSISTQSHIDYKQLKLHDRLLFKIVIYTPPMALLKSKSCNTTMMH